MPASPLRARLLACAAPILFASPLAAQETVALVDETEAVAIALPPIVVEAAAGFEQSVEDAPASVTVIGREELEKGAFSSLTDALRGVQGVTVTGVSAEKDIQIRGLPGQYTLILIDGKRQGTRESRPNGSAGWEQSLIPPLAAVERIEIIRGPMSALHGADAMGGVINIVTRKTPPEWTGTVSAEGVIPGNDVDGGDRQGSFYAAGPIIRDRLSLAAWGRRYQRDEANEIDGALGAEESDLGARFTLIPAEGHELRLGGGFTRLEQSASPNNTLAAGEPRTRQVNTRAHWDARWLADWELFETDLSFQQEWGEKRNWTEGAGGAMVKSDRSPEIMNAVLDGTASFEFTALGPHRMVLGGQYSRAELTDQNPGRATTADETFAVSQGAVFAEDEWSITDDLALTTGLRLTSHEVYGEHLSPRAYAVWHATGALTVKGGVSTGFRAPDIRQLTDGYYYTTQRGAGVIVSNPDLQPEKTLSYEFGGLWTSGDWQLGATAFRTEFSDKIESANSGGTIVVDGTTYNRWEYYNVSSALLQGIELTAGWEPLESLSLRASYTYTKSEQESGTYKGLPLARTPEHQASLRADWTTPIEGLTAWGAATIRGPEVNAGARIGTNGTPAAYNASGAAIAYEYDGYTTVDLGITWAAHENATVKAAVYNIADQGLDAASNNAVGEGRRFWLGLDVRF